MAKQDSYPRSRFARFMHPANVRIIKELVRVHLKTKDYDSLLGIIWSSLGPVAMLLVLYTMFHERFAEGMRNYALYLLVGIVPVNFFVTATANMLRAFNEYREMLLNTVLPREDVMVAELCAHLYKFLIESSVGVFLCIAYTHAPWYCALTALPLIVAFVAFVFGIGCALSVAYSFARDIEHIWGIVGRFVYFFTPVFFTLHSISWWARVIVEKANPLTTFLIALRQLLLEQGLVSGWYWYSLILGAAVGAGGYALFCALEHAALERS
jgi:ABC-type polysaccharide/polyol phosphate export permease